MTFSAETGLSETLMGPGTSLVTKQVGALLAERAAGRQPGQAVWPPGLPVRIRKDRLNHCVV